MKVIRLIKRKKVTAILISILMLIITVVTIIVHLNDSGYKNEISKQKTMEYTVASGDLSFSVSDSTTASYQDNSQLFELSIINPDIELVVEKVLAKASDEVTKGQELYQLDKTSVSEAYDYYKKLVTQYQNQYSKAKLEYDNESINEASEYLTNKNLQNSALVEYNEAVEELDEAITQAKADVEDTNDLIETLTDNINSNVYYTNNNVEKLKKDLDTVKKELEKAKSSDETKKLKDENSKLNSKLKELSKNVENSRKSVKEKKKEYQNALDEMVSYASQNEDIASEYVNAFNEKYKAWQEADKKLETLEKQSEDYSKQIQLNEEKIKTTENNQNQLNKKYEEASRAYTEAKKRYTSELEEAKKQLSDAVNQVDSLKKTYDDAASSKTEQLLKLQKEYDTDVIISENADVLHDIALLNLDTEVNAAKEKLSNAKADLKIIEAIKKNYTITASQAGTISSLAYEEDDDIVIGQEVVSYVSEGIVSATIEVSQKDIAGISVGDSATVTSSAAKRGKGSEGVVSSISTAPVTDGSVSSVNYEVTVTVNEDEDESIAAGDTVTVSIATEELKDVLYVPTSMITASGANSYIILKHSDGSTKKKSITTGKDNGNFTVVTQGLSDGDVCITDNQK